MTDSGFAARAIGAGTPLSETAAAGSVIVTESLPALPASSAPLLWRGLTAADTDALLRGVAPAFVPPVSAPPPERRCGAAFDAVFVADVAARPEVWSLVEPVEPVVSAYATGKAEIAEPTPNATANMPTRPTYRDNLVCAVDSEKR